MLQSTVNTRVEKGRGTVRKPYVLTAFVIVMALCGTPVGTAQSEVATRPLKGISALAVLVEDLPDGAKKLGLTKGTIQTDVELKLRLAGVRVETLEKSIVLPGSPTLYVSVNVADDGRVAYIEVSLEQNVLLERNGDFWPSAKTWSSGGLIEGPATEQDIRDRVKDNVDDFLNAWLSVNPKK